MNTMSRLIPVTLLSGLLLVGCGSSERQRQKQKDLEDRVEQLEKTVHGLAARPPVETGSARLAALEKKVTTLEQRLKLLLSAPAAPEPDIPAPERVSVSGIKQTGPYHYEITTETLGRFIRVAAAGGRGLKIAPSLRNGKAEGFKLSMVGPDTVHRAMGFRSGDVLLSVNRKPLASLAAALELYAGLRRVSRFTVEFRRAAGPWFLSSR